LQLDIDFIIPETRNFLLRFAESSGNIWCLLSFNGIDKGPTDDKLLLNEDEMFVD
jgi:hypothetical protein